MRDKMREYGCKKLSDHPLIRVNEDALKGLNNADRIDVCNQIINYCNYWKKWEP